MTEKHSALMDHFLKLFRHMKWADIRVLKLLEQENISSGKVVELISHIVLTEDTWYKRITNEFYDNKFWKILTIEECRKIVDDTNLKFMNYILSLSESDFQKKISYKNSRGIDYMTSVEGILTHVALHGMYHRGQIMLLMRNSGQEVIETDYVVYIREYESEESKL
jgi:uncharacterized damage-inducible protein DinB